MENSLDHILAALADPTRRAVIDLLHARPRPAGELAAAFHMSPPAMSRHLRVLRRTGLVEPDPAGLDDARLRIYRLRRAPFVKLHNWVAQIETFWSGQLAAFKEHAELTRKGRRH